MLISQDDLLENQEDWLKEMIAQIMSNFSPQRHPPFPCIFSRKAFQLKLFKFLPIYYVNDNYDFNALLKGLEDYLELHKNWDGKFTTAYPLLVIFQPIDKLKDINYCEDLFVSALQYLIDRDSESWEQCEIKDPNKEFWSMQFRNIQLFINVSHHNNVNRLSRNLCDTLVFVINPRERFDIFAGNDPKGVFIRDRIRENIDQYDKIKRSPILGHYLNGDLEWPQYFLPDENDAEPLQCPLRFKNDK